MQSNRAGRPPRERGRSARERGKPTREGQIMDFLPVCCDRFAFETMRRAAMHLETPAGLIEGAVAIARHEMPDASPEPVKQQLFDLARDLRARVRGEQPQALVAHLHDLLFEQQGFIGNTLNYHDPANSYLPSVLETRRGLPITLSLVYKIVGERAGLDIRGIGLPGHFCAGVDMGDGLDPMIVDTFYSGRLLNHADALERMRDTYGPHVEWSDDLLKPVTHRHWLTRLMQNLLHTFSEKDRLTDVAAMLELELVLWPEQTHLQRDLALVLARVGMAEPASRWLGTYLEGNPDDPQRDDLEQLLVVLAPRKLRRAS
ncbi:MAG: transglutaminase-like domain-containing protein [Tepidisphaeraceae bacterium]